MFHEEYNKDKKWAWGFLTHFSPRKEGIQNHPLHFIMREKALQTRKDVLSKRWGR